MSPGGAAQPLPVGTPDESQMEEDQPGSASASPNQLEPEDASMSPDKAAQPPHLGAAEDDPMESPSLSPGSMFADLLWTGDMSEEPYPCAMEGAEESGPEKEATRPAGSGRGRLHTSTRHTRHVPGPYLLTFRSSNDPIPRPPSPVYIPGHGPAPGTLTADSPSRLAPVPAGRVPPSFANTGFGAEFDAAARNSLSPPPEGPCASYTTCLGLGCEVAGSGSATTI